MLSWFYIIIAILFLHYTGLYEKLPEPIPKYFEVLGMFIPSMYPSVDDDIEGVYESDFKQHGFKKHFMITRDLANDANLISIKYRGSKSPTDDPVKLLEKEISDMKKNALDTSYKHKTPVVMKGDVYEISGTVAKREGTVLVFEKDGKTVKYSKIRDI
jgi:hypothetical protein